MKIKTLSVAILTAMILVITTTPPMIEAFALCYSNPVVGINGATGFDIDILFGYNGYTGVRLVTAGHVVGDVGSPVTVTTTCGGFQEKVLYKDQTKDFAFIGTFGILFSGSYIQGNSYVGETVNITPWSGSSFSGYVKYLNYMSQYQTAICTRTLFVSGTSGSPVRDTLSGNAVGVAKALGPSPGSLCGSGTWYFLIAYNGA